jgi:D-alanyl-D-alanine carboxypeptidase
MLFCLAVGLAVLVAASPTPSAVPPAHTFTAKMANRIDDLGMQTRRDRRSPGLAIAVVEDGRIVYAKGFGYGDLSERRLFDAGTQSYVGGISQQFTAAAILLLQQDGKLKLDDKVTKYVPELTISPNVTIQQLLSQTSGLPDYTKAPGLKVELTRTVKLGDIIAAVNKMKPAAEPGAQFAYNDFNYMIAGLVVERASGVPLSDYLQQHIFLPLVMNATFYAGDRGISPAHAVGYTGSPGHFVRADAWDPAWLYGWGGLVTNVYDLAKWDIGLPLLLRVDAERAMFTPSGAPGEAQYGLGWVIDERGGKRYIWHNGEIAGYLAMNAILPDDNISVVVVENTDRFTSRRVAMPEAIAADVLDILIPPAAMHVDNAVMGKAREWLARIADKRIDRTQLTPAFSAYLTDSLVARSNFSALGKPEALVPIASSAGDNGDVVYEFLVRFPHEHYHYKLTLAKDGKIDGLVLTP